MKKFAAVDLGAESGRIIVGDLNNIDSIDYIDVVYRFPNRPVRIGESIFWDILGLFAEIKTGLNQAFSKYNGKIASIGVDTWGVDYCLLDEQGDLLGNLYHYRDKRTDRIPEEFFKLITKREVFEETGIQLMQINTLYQLYAHIKAKPWITEQAGYFLTLPDLLNFWLTGIKKNEFSHATTTQLYNPVLKNWSPRLLKTLGLNREIFSEIIQPGTVIGKLLPHIAREIEADPGTEVIAPACHDTGSAVAAVPVLSSGDYAYLSSGTWSLLGIESAEPIINDKSFACNFTNEGAADGGFRFLKNIIGLWIVQECKRFWDSEGKSYSYTELTKMAEHAGPAVFKVDVNDPRFLKPGEIDDSMPDRIRAYCIETDQQRPVSPGEMIRGILESLADMYAATIKKIEEVTGRSIKELYIIGGGSKNSLLCRLTAGAAGLPVYAGPVEATAIGNIMVQSIASGSLESIAQGRSIVREKYKIKKYLP